jgi:hypothetical protein
MTEPLLADLRRRYEGTRDADETNVLCGDLLAEVERLFAQAEAAEREREGLQGLLTTEAELTSRLTARVAALEAGLREVLLHVTAYGSLHGGDEAQRMWKGIVGRARALLAAGPKEEP